jgi:hypothetical protein
MPQENCKPSAAKAKEMNTQHLHLSAGLTNTDYY